MNIKELLKRIKDWIMANYADLKAAIANAIKYNDNHEITGEILQEQLLAIINALGTGYQFISIATPATEPGTPDSNVMYIAGAGTYPNFGATKVPQGSFGVFRYNGSWDYSVLDVASWADTSNKLYYNAQAGNVAAKTIQADGFTLQPGGWIKVHFNNANEAANPTLNVNNTGAHTMTFNGALVSETNSWKVGETVAFYYDNYGIGIWHGIRLVEYPDFINVNDLIGETTPFADANAARTAIPQQNRKPGLNIAYLLSTGEETSQWQLDMFIGDDVTNWDVAANWQSRSIDNEPQPGSSKLVKSGGVKDIDTLVFNLLQYNPQAQPGKNLFDKNNMFPYGGFFGADGSFLPSIYAILSNVIKVDGISQLYTNKVGADGQYGKFYKKDGSSLSVINSNVNVINIPEGAYYLVWPIFPSNINSQQIEIGNTGTTYEAFKMTNTADVAKSVDSDFIDNEPQPGSSKLVKSGGVKDIDTFIFLYANALNKGLKVGKNLFDKNNMFPYRGFFEADGKFVNSIYATLSNPIRVMPGEHLYANYHSSSGQYGKFYGVDGSTISVINFNVNQIVVPDNAYYLVLPIEPSNVNKTQIEIGDAATSYESYSVENVADDLDGKLELALPDKVGQFTFLKLLNQQQYFESLTPSRITRNDNVLTITGTGTTGSNYFGIKHSTMFAGINKPAGSNVAVAVRAKVVGDLKNIILSVGSYPVYSAKPTISKLFKNNGMFIGVAYITIPENISDGQFYISITTTSNFSVESTITIESWGFSILDSDENLLTKQIEELVNRSIPNEQIQNIAITCKRNGTSGVDADYCGLTAISDALNAITDASYFKRYTLIIDGVFEFTDPLTIPMPDRNNVEHSIINCKPYVSFQGMGIDRTVLFVNIPANATFHDGRSYADYQPVYLYCEGEVNFSNMSILGRNCRYAFHLEAGAVPNNTIRNIKNCRVIHFGLDGYQSQGFEHAFGCGMGNGHVWNIENCYAQSTTAAFAIHSVSAFSNSDKFPQGICNIRNCELNGRLYAGNGQVPGVCQLNFDNCIINNQTLSIATSPIGSTEKVNSDYSNIKLWFNTPALPIYQNFQKGIALRVDSLLDNSTIRFDETASAFNALIGINQLYNPIFTELALYETNGYRYRDGGVGLKGFAYGLKDATNNNLAKSLGDCSSTSKSLVINISGTDYTVTFNSNYTNLTNNDVVDAINAVIGSVATASLYYPIKDYFPHFKDLQYKSNTESDAPILRGMGVYFTSQGMRRAKNSDGFIDGVCLDDIAPGQVGRVISSGSMYDMSQRATQSTFTILELVTTMNQQRAELGISVDNDGYFDRNATPKVVKCIKNAVVQLPSASI